MGFIKKAKDKFREIDDKHDELRAKVANLSLNEDHKESGREDAREILDEARYEKESEEDDGAMIHFHPMRDWEEKKAHRFLDLTGGDDYDGEERSAADVAATRERAEYATRVFAAREENATDDAQRRYKAKKGTW
jgi:hypothetical protein